MQSFFEGFGNVGLLVQKRDATNDFERRFALKKAERLARQVSAPYEKEKKKEEQSRKVAEMAVRASQFTPSAIPLAIEATEKAIVSGKKAELFRPLAEQAKKQLADAELKMLMDTFKLEKEADNFVRQALRGLNLDDLE
jgi:hypothetical protein